MNINSLPDTFYKVLVYLGIAMIVYGFIFVQNETINFEKERLTYNSTLKKIENDRFFLNEELKLIYGEADTYSRKLNIKNPLTISKQGYIFDQTLSGEKNNVLLSDTISSLLKRYNKKQIEIKSKDADLDVQKYLIDEKRITFKENIKLAVVIFLIGFTLAGIGFVIWIVQEGFHENFIKRQNLGLPTFSVCCQSCGIKFSSVVEYGTNLNSDKNYNFCITCYYNGEFVEKDLSLVIISERIKIELENQNYKKRYISKVLRKLKFLDRWKRDIY